MFTLKDHQAKYLILSSLARNNLACSASSCAAERTFSAAVDVCSSNCGKLLPRAIKMCISNRMWLKNDVPVIVDFATANDLVKQYTSFKENKKTKTNDITVDTKNP
jgi:hypothetical protein